MLLQRGRRGGARRVEGGAREGGEREGGRTSGRASSRSCRAEKDAPSVCVVFRARERVHDRLDGSSEVCPADRDAAGDEWARRTVLEVTMLLRRGGLGQYTALCRSQCVLVCRLKSHGRERAPQSGHRRAGEEDEREEGAEGSPLCASRCACDLGDPHGDGRAGYRLT